MSFRDRYAAKLAAESKYSTFAKKQLWRASKKGAMKRRTKTSANPSELSVLKERLDTLFSRYVRASAADDDGFLRCFICGRELHWKTAVLMHYQGRAAMYVRYNEKNCQPGCSLCNGKPLGDRENFGRRIDETFGEGTAAGLYEASKKTARFGRAWFETRIAYYTALLEAMGI